MLWLLGVYLRAVNGGMSRLLSVDTDFEGRHELTVCIPVLALGKEYSRVCSNESRSMT